MDETLKRILSLFPTNESGKPVRGSSKELADYLRLPHNIVAEWKSGRNKSYLRYLYEISAKYGVSVAWLKGETDEKTPPTKNVDGVGELSDAEKHLIELFRQLPEDSQESFPALLEASLKAQGLL